MDRFVTKRARSPIQRHCSATRPAKRQATLMDLPGVVQIAPVHTLKQQLIAAGFSDDGEDVRTCTFAVMIGLRRLQPCIPLSVISLVVRYYSS